jgi:cobalamin biosynthesis Mg chelatase CobN
MKKINFPLIYDYIKSYVYPILILLLLIGCGTKTKTKTESSNEIALKEQARKSDSIKTIDLIINKKVEEKVKEYIDQSKSSSESVSEDKDVTTITEISTDAPATITLTDGRVLNLQNGKITETKSTATKKNNTKAITEKNIEISERSQSIIDEVNIKAMSREIVEEVLTDLSKKETSKTGEQVKKGWQPGFWFWFWIILILLIAIALWLFRKYLGIQFPFLQMFKFFR